nr:natural cytotoxicity triggering receptor 3 ligand 1-like isoform X1 [Chelonoidis abingdonii]
MSCSPLTLLIVLSLFGGCAGKLAVETDASPVRAKVGDDVVLKCQFAVAQPPVDLSQLVVQWFHRGGQLVEFDDVVSESRPGASLNVEGLRSGNAALYLSKVTPESAGNYRCYITYAPDVRIKQVVLHVEGKAAGPPGGLPWGPAMGSCHRLANMPLALHRTGSSYPQAAHSALSPHSQCSCPISPISQTELLPAAHSAPCWTGPGLA